eukprot:c26774_g1_i2 orf=324-2075(-)
MTPVAPTMISKSQMSEGQRIGIPSVAWERETVFCPTIRDCVASQNDTFRLEPERARARTSIHRNRLAKCKTVVPPAWKDTSARLMTSSGKSMMMEGIHSKLIAESSHSKRGDTPNFILAKHEKYLQNKNITRVGSSREGTKSWLIDSGSRLEFLKRNLCQYGNCSTSEHNRYECNSPQAQFKNRNSWKQVGTELRARRREGTETCSWLDVVKPYRGLQISEEEWPTLSKSCQEHAPHCRQLFDKGDKELQCKIVCNRKSPVEVDKKHCSNFNPLAVDGSSSTNMGGATSCRGYGRRKEGRLQCSVVGNATDQCNEESKEENLSWREDMEGEQTHRRNNDHDLQMTPILLMVNRDFIVASPLKHNLLLTLALMERKQSLELSNDGLLLRKHERERRQILVGHFTAFSSFLHFGLGHDATRIRSESNAGGTSTISESLSVEYFVRRFQARDVVTEMEVEYCAMNWKKVDYICTLYGQRVGVSVTRAMSFPDPTGFSSQMAYRLLYKKLFGLVVARHGVTKRHSFSQCILHVWCETQQTAKILEQEYDGVSQELDITDDVIMVLTIAQGSHARPIFYEFLLKQNEA